MKILCFIFSWKGQFANAISLEEYVAPFVDHLVVINSDDDNKPEHWVNIGNECYFSDQFRKALEISNQYDYDVLWHIQADVSFDDWSKVLKSAKESDSKYDWAVFAPNVDDTFYISHRTDVFSLEEKYKVVATPDNSCWMIKKKYVELLKNEYLHLMKDNHLGWGWDLIVCGLAHNNKEKVVRDYSITVNHPKSTGYKKEQAEQEMLETFNKSPKFLQEAVYRIKMEPTSLIKYHNTTLQNKDLFVYEV